MTARPTCEVSWFSALCDDDYEFLGVPDPMLKSSWEHCRDIVQQALHTRHEPGDGARRRDVAGGAHDEDASQEAGNLGILRSGCGGPGASSLCGRIPACGGVVVRALGASTWPRPMRRSDAAELVAAGRVHGPAAANENRAVVGPALQATVGTHV